MFAGFLPIWYYLRTLKQKIWLTLINYLSYCINKELYQAIEYLKTQDDVLLEQQEKQNKRILLTNNQRIRLAAKARQLRRKMLDQGTVLFTPDTVIRWYQKLIAQKYDGSMRRGKAGRPPISQDIIDLVVRFKKENLRWGYQKITDQIVYLGHEVSKSTVKNILIENSLDPEPDLTVRSTWHEFIRSHWEVLSACDFFTLELLAGRKRIRCTVFFVMELCTRKVFIAPIKLQPEGEYMKQVASIVTDFEEGYVLKNYCEYSHHERIPQSLGRTIEPKHVLDDRAEIPCIERLGGLLKSYHRLAA